MVSIIYCLNYGYCFKIGYEQVLLDGKCVQVEFVCIGQVGVYIVDFFLWFNNLLKFFVLWKKEGEELYEFERKFYVGNFEKGFVYNGWNFLQFMQVFNEVQDMGMEELVFDLGILVDVGFDIFIVVLDWFLVFWILIGFKWVVKVQKILDEVVGRDCLFEFVDREKLLYIDVIGKLLFMFLFMKFIFE